MLFKFYEINKLFNYFSILLINVAFSKEKPPFKNILVLDKPKVYKEIIFQDREGNQLDLNQINTNELYILRFGQLGVLHAKMKCHL